MADTADLTERQRQLIHHLPADSESLSEALGVAPTTVKDHIARIRDNGISVPYDTSKNVYYLKDEQKTRRVSTKHTGTKTREANDYITEVFEVIGIWPQPVPRHLPAFIEETVADRAYLPDQPPFRAWRIAHDGCMIELVSHKFRGLTQ